MHAPVTASATCITAASPRSPSAAAVAVVEPLGLVRVADHARELDRAVRVEQLAARDARVARVRRVLEHVEPAGMRDDVGVDQHDVLVGAGRGDPAVAVAREAALRGAEHELDAVTRLQRSQLLHVFGPRPVVGDDDADELALRGPPDAADRLRGHGRVAERRDDHRTGGRARGTTGGPARTGRTSAAPARAATRSA